MTRLTVRRPIIGLATAALLAGCIAQPPFPSDPAPRSAGSPGLTGPPGVPTVAPAASDPTARLPQPGSAADWQAAVVLAPDRRAFQRASGNQGPIPGDRTVWQITADGSFIPAEPIATAQRSGVIGTPTGFADWADEGVVRWSPDGLSWFDDPSGPIAANLSTIVPVGERLLLVGQAVHSRAGAWLSDDGRSWAEALGAPLDLWSATEWPGHGIVAAGGSGPSTAVWSSVDGSSWRAVGTPRPANGWASVAGLAAAPSGVVAIGDVDGRPAAWHTTDLVTWTEAGAAWGRDAWLGSIIRLGDAFIVSGRRANRPALWVSANGTVWSAVDLPLANGLTGDAAKVCEIHRQPIVFGYTTEDAGNGGWSRTDDLVWVLGRWPSW